VDSSKRLLRIAEAVDKLGGTGKQLVQTELDREYTARVHQYRYEWAGLVSGVAIAVLGLWLAYLLIHSGNTAAATGGTVLGVSDLVGLVSVFVYGTQRREAIKPPKPRERQP
jgi:uncharacterized membrane protein